VASAAANMQNLARDLPPDEQAIQRAKRSEFHSLGLVLGYSYAGSPVIQPPGGPAAGTAAAGDVTDPDVTDPDVTDPDVTDPDVTDPDVTDYTPDSTPGARLPHHWLPDGSSLYDRLGAGLTLVGPAHDGASEVAALTSRARQRGIPLAVVQPPPSYPWHQEYLLVRPDQHIAWRAGRAADIDLDVVTGAATGD
jgi:hypothetical protein